MRLSPKTLLLWLLIAVLPIQGMAAVVKAFCGPGRHESISVAGGAKAHYHVRGLGAHDHHDDEVAANHHNPEASAAATDVSLEKNHAHKSSQCGACAACCFGAAAPPPTVSWDPALVSSRHVVRLPAIQFTGFIPGGLERPPRHVSV